MQRTRLFSIILCAAAMAGCGPDEESTTDGDVATDGGGMGGRDSGVMPTGDASLSFVPTWGNADAQFQGSNWQAMLDLGIFQPAIEANRDTRLVILLCASGDTTCEAPVVAREVRADETDGDPIQDSFGPDVLATGLPAGTYELMIFADTGVSRAHGLGWDAGFETEETAWGGYVSELDVMLSSAPVSAGVTPPPATMTVTLTDGATTDLGTLKLQHVHERDISPDPNLEPGRMAVAVADGIRLIDTGTHSLIELSPGNYTHRMNGPGGAPFTGTVCGMVDGPDDTVFLLYEGGGVGAGFAVQFDVGDAAQMHAGHRIVFGDAGTPCRGRYHDGTLYVTNASASRLNHPASGADENLWYADVTGLPAADVNATLLDRNDYPVLQHGVDDIAALGDTLYMTINGANAVGGLPGECTSAYCVFSATIAIDGEPVLDAGSGYTYWVGPGMSASYPSPMGEVTCTEYGSPWSAIQVARVADGRDLLFLGGCLEVAAFDTATGQQVDLGAAPGVQGIDGTLFGFAFNAFALSPDGNTLWALPQQKSAVHFYFASGVDGTRATFSRYMALPIDLGAAGGPALASAFEGDDMDGYDGTTNIGPYVTPANDPGVDINLGWYTGYRVGLLPSTPGFQPASFPNGPSLVATNESLWVRGAGNAEAGASGLGKSGNLAVYDLATRRMILHPYDDTGYYRFWHGGSYSDPGFGFDLEPTRDTSIATFGLRWVPAP